MSQLKNPKKLAKLLTQNIMIFHDTADYSGLGNNSNLLLLEMGYSKSLSRQIANLIKKIYIVYDKAHEERTKNNLAKEKEFYARAKRYAKKINEISTDKNDSQILVDIVINWRHGNKITALLKFFKFWNNSLSIINALKASYHQLRAAYSHDKRNIKDFEYHFLKIYNLLLKQNKLPILF